MIKTFVLFRCLLASGLFFFIYPDEGGFLPFTRQLELDACLLANNPTSHAARTQAGCVFDSLKCAASGRCHQRKLKPSQRARNVDVDVDVAKTSCGWPTGPDLT